MGEITRYISNFNGWSSVMLLVITILGIVFTMFVIARLLGGLEQAVSGGSGGGRSARGSGGGRSARGGGGERSAHGGGGGGGGELLKGAGEGLGSLAKGLGPLAKGLGSLAKGAGDGVGGILRGAAPVVGKVGNGGKWALKTAGRLTRKAGSKAAGAAKGRYSAWQAERAAKKTEQEAERALEKGLEEWEHQAIKGHAQMREEGQEAQPMPTGAMRYRIDGDAGPYVISRLLDRDVRFGVTEDETGQRWLVVPSDAQSDFENTLEESGITCEEGEPSDWDDGYLVGGNQEEEPNQPNQQEQL